VAVAELAEAQALLRAEHWREELPVDCLRQKLFRPQPKLQELIPKRVAVARPSFWAWPL
jgi:lambda repressor-like predicted transcriptional regulator